MRFRFYSLKPDIMLLFYTDKNLRADDTIIKLYDKVVSYGKPFDLDRYCIDDGGWEKVRIPDTFKEIEKLIPDPEFHVIVFRFIRQADYSTDLVIVRRGYDGFDINGGLTGPSNVTLTIGRELFEKDKTKELTEKFVRVAKDMYVLLNPYYGYGHDRDDRVLLTRKHKRFALNSYGKRISTPYWMNFFGPELVENLGGKEKVMNAPGWRKEALGDGGVLLLATPSPLNPRSRPYRRRFKEIADYFGISK